jgi:hypothetical protein
METANKEFLAVRAIPLWLHIIQYGIIAMLSVPLFKEIESDHINVLRLSVLVIVSVVLLGFMILMDRRYYKQKADLGLFLKNDKFIYSPNSSLTLEVDWKNVEGLEKKGTGTSNYIIPVLKDSTEMRILKAGWFGKRWLKGNIKNYGMPVVINPFTLNTSVYDLSGEIEKHF